MADISLLPADLDAEIDDVLSLLPLLEAVPSLSDRVFHRLVDCLVEAVLHDVRTRHDTGVEIGREERAVGHAGWFDAFPP